MRLIPSRRSVSMNFLTLLVLLGSSIRLAVCPGTSIETYDRPRIFTLTPTGSFCEANAQCVSQGLLHHEQWFLTGKRYASTVPTNNRDTVFTWTSLNRLCSTSNNIFRDGHPIRMKRQLTTTEAFPLTRINWKRNEALLCYFHGTKSRLTECSFNSKFPGTVICEYAGLLGHRNTKSVHFRLFSHLSSAKVSASRCLSFDSCHKVIDSQTVSVCAIR